ncbi:MAG: HAMP domain-containing histidine kinase [Gemmatimonadota bacterium]|nr:HAMP domain-containing histidine kinase [Gemmatimonadota bacterium]
MPTEEPEQALIDQAHLSTLATLVAGVAHELNTPLGAIRSNHDVIERALLKLQDILEDEVVTPDELQDVRKIVRAMDGVLRTNGIAVDRMRQIVESLGTFGRPDRAEVDRVDLREGLNGTLAVLNAELKKHSVVKDYQDIPDIECFPNRLNQVFMNLVHNAAQAMEPGGTLTVRTRTDADAVVIEVEDTGKGISPDHLAEIFKPGFTTKGQRMGMGLGLAISKQIIDHHGGSISANSTVGAGTTFRLSLPLTLPANTRDEGGSDASA